MKNRYEVTNKDTGKLIGTFSYNAIKAIGFKEDNYIVKKIENETESDRVKQEGKY